MPRYGVHTGELEKQLLKGSGWRAKASVRGVMIWSLPLQRSMSKDCWSEKTNSKFGRRGLAAEAGPCARARVARLEAAAAAAAVPRNWRRESRGSTGWGMGRLPGRA
mgnify:CR=1 FL=1